ncbi:MAG: patatin-like phospholipase family protein [Chloroflexaceae bacterium]|jgi:NTE family protein|nr:patatin-like phospholipase family protein [Chloroflexaceae bacterium]
MTTRKTALVLSGGGARGAYHVGVIEALVAAGWMEDGKGPDIIAGTSIGAVNAAALASGLTVEQLKARWCEMQTEDVHRLSTDLPPLARPFAHFLLHSLLTSETQHGTPDKTLADDSPGMWERLNGMFRSRPFRSLLDTAPWRQTIDGWMDFPRLNSAHAPALLLTATELQSGTLQIFCNRDLNGRPADTLGVDHLIASCSIPIVYPWTEIGGGKYWDGAVIANTPLEPVIDLAGDADLDIIVVMMTPWETDPATMRAKTRPMPQDLVQALTLTLDWALLASYRVAFEMLHHRNQLAAIASRLAAVAGDAGLTDSERAEVSLRQIRLPTVVAPEEIMPLEWMVDYELATHHKLFAMGYADALRALAARG